MIKAGDEFETNSDASLRVKALDVDRSALLVIGDDESYGYWFWSKDIKALRKFLKKLQKQLEAGTVDE